ncbi:MAG: ABC transporter ATP-binding protein, partial [Myxococcota bacterium]|nr:ABC transporter ATP-binding protein [Myxococcota bacterium]
MPKHLSVIESRWALEVKDLSVKYRRYIRKVNTLKDFVTHFFTQSHYDEFWALNGVSLRVEKGECLGVIGPNGAGKSTLLKVLARVIEPEEGEIVVNGKLIPLLELGAGFRGDLTGRENVQLNAAIFGLPHYKMPERTKSIVEFAEIGDFIDAPINTYSSGMRARLGFSVACDFDADIYLLDEIFSAGDVAFRKKALARTRKLFSDKKTIVFVSHSLGQVRELCSRVIYMNGGRIVFDGETEKAISMYL